MRDKMDLLTRKMITMSDLQTPYERKKNSIITFKIGKTCVSIIIPSKRCIDDPRFSCMAI